MSERRTRRLLIHGRVQGVWFRESMRLEAERLGVTGWVRNRLDGSVEAMVQGDGEAIAAIERWAHRGPQAAEVARVEAFDAQGDFATFEKLPTRS
jgi:acylphosphatase